jgi:hypothetical protein
LRLKLYAVTGACIAAAVCTFPGVAGAAEATPAPPATTGAAAPVFRAPAQAGCPKPTSLSEEQCQSITIARGQRVPGAHAAASTVNAPLSASQLQSAYGLTTESASDGTGETVAVVDAYRDPTIVGDLAAYRLQNGLPACGTGNGCFTVYNQSGGVINPATAKSPSTPPDTAADDELEWENETALDIEMVSAICPNCKIALFEANSVYTPDLGAAENSAAKIAKFISNSWSTFDYPGESAYDSDFNHPGVAITFASGDGGYGAAYPSSSQYVTSVGGTYLDQGSTGAWTQQIWNQQAVYGEPDVAATSAGCSASEPEPSWGPDASDNTAANWCANRTQNDVSAVASAAYGIGVYSETVDSQQYNTCGGDCALVGTSVAAPIIAAVYALAGTPAASTYPVSYLYKDPSGLTQIATGTPTYSTDRIGGGPTCEASRQYLCNVTKSLSDGYNGPTGLGTPGGGDLTPFTGSTTADTVSVGNPGTYDLQQGVSVTLPAIRAIDSLGQKLTYSATGMPAGLAINPATGVISGKVVNVENDTIHVTARDTSGASATVSFRIEASGSLTASYHAGSGQVELYWDGKCMDDTGNKSTNGNKIQIWQCTSNDAGQNWSFQPDTNPGEVADAGLSQLGTVRIHGKCLNIVNNGTTNGSKLQLWGCNGGANEQWEITGGFGQLYNPVSGKCVDDPYSSKTNGTQLDIWSCNDEPWQAWLAPASPFDSAISGRCMDDSGNSSKNGAAVISETCNGSAAERWLVYPDGTLRINGKCMNAVGNGTTNGTTVQLFSCGSSSTTYSANYWYLTAYGQIENAQAEKCLSIPGNSAANGVRLELEDCYGEPGEIWAAS